MDLYFFIQKYKILSCHLSAKNAERFEGKKEDVESPRRERTYPQVKQEAFSAKAALYRKVFK